MISTACSNGFATCRYHRETNSFFSLPHLTEAELAYEILWHECREVLLRKTTFLFGALRAPVRALPVPITVNAVNQTALDGRRHSRFAVRDCAFRAACAVSGCPRDWDINQKNRVFARVNYFRTRYPFNTAVGGINLISAESDFRDAHTSADCNGVTRYHADGNEFRFSILPE